MADPGSDLARERARAGVLRVVGLQGPVARKTIAELLAVSPATVTTVTKELLAAGLLEQVGKTPPEGGRPAELLELVSGSAHLIGAKVAPDRVIGVCTDLRGAVAAEFTAPFDARADHPLDVLEQILQAHMGDVAGTLLGIGLGVPGMVDTADGGRVFAPTLGWEHLKVGATLQAQLGVPVIVENDVHTLAVAERLFGRGREIDDFVTVTVGRGIGLGIVVGGVLHRGFRGGAAELGHVQVDPSGARCDCGRIGCLEAVASDPALLRRARAEGLIGASADVVELRDLAAAGDAKAIRIFREAGRQLGTAVANVVNLIAPGLVIVSGEGAASWPVLSPSFEDAYRTAVLPVHADVEVVVDPLEDSDWARGAVSLLMRSVFAPSSTDGAVERLVRTRLAATTREQGR